MVRELTGQLGLDLDFRIDGDELAVVRDLGFDELVLARQVGAADAETRLGPVATAMGEVPRLRGQLPPVEIDETPQGMPPTEHLVRSMFQQVWNGRRLDRITAYYSPAAVIKTSTDRTLNGPVALRHHILEWLAEITGGDFVEIH